MNQMNIKTVLAVRKNMNVLQNKPDISMIYILMQSNRNPSVREVVPV